MPRVCLSTLSYKSYVRIRAKILNILKKILPRRIHAYATMLEAHTTMPILYPLRMPAYTRGGSRIFRTSVKIFLADGALSALGVVSTGRGRLQAGRGGSGR
jgi:hypothetical protein